MNPLQYFIKRWTEPRTIFRYLAASTPQEKYRNQYLVSPRWVFVRRMSVTLWGDECSCGRKVSDVHHENYGGKNKPGLAGMIREVLTTRPTCRACHKKDHK